MSDYLSMYAKAFSLPIQLDTSVTKLDKVEDHFRLYTNNGEFQGVGYDAEYLIKKLF
jgi:putative flavoprotein involved in K+ transport